MVNRSYGRWKESGGRRFMVDYQVAVATEFRMDGTSNHPSGIHSDVLHRHSV